MKQYFSKNLWFLVVVFACILFGTSCIDNSRVKSDLMPRVTTPPRKVKLDTIQGYKTHPYSGHKIDVILDGNGDTAITGKAFKTDGRKLTQEEIITKEFLIGKPKVEPFSLKKKNKCVDAPFRPFALDTMLIPINAALIEKRPFISSIGDTIPTGKALKITGHKVAAIQNMPITAKSPVYKDNSTMDISYLGTKEGMPNSNAACIIKDSKNRIWIGLKDQGIIIYDGLRFTHIIEKEGLINPYIYSLLEDKNGNIWIGTNNGLCMYDGQKFTHYNDLVGIPFSGVYSIIEDKSGSLWFGTGNGLCRFKNDEFTYFTTNEGLNHDTVRVIEEDKVGHLWLATPKGITIFDGNKFTTLNAPKDLPFNQITEIKFTETDEIWIGTNDGLLNVKKDSIRHIKDINGLPGNQINSLIQESSGKIFITIRNKGIGVFDGQEFSFITEKEGLSSSDIKNVIEIENGVFWAATSNNGINRINTKGFSAIRNMDFTENQVIYPIFNDSDGSLWIGSSPGNGLIQINEGKVYNWNNELNSINSIWSLFRDSKGILWIGTWGSGLFKIEGNKCTQYGFRTKNSPNIVMSIEEDEQGKIWLATYGGIFTFDGKSFTVYDNTCGLTGHQFRHVFKFRNGDLWFTGKNKSILKYDGKYFTSYSEKEGLLGDGEGSIMEDEEGRIWYSGFKGINVINGTEITFIQEENGLVQNSSATMIKDKKGNIWIGTQNGMSLVTKKYYDKWISKIVQDDSNNHPSIINFNASNGLIPSDFNSNKSAAIDQNNRAWWGAGLGTMYSLDLSEFVLSNKAPEISLTQINIQEKFYDFKNFNDSLKKGINYTETQAFYNIPINLTLDYQHNHLTFYFTAFDWASSQKTQYSYKIQDLDKNWSDVSDEVYADYRNLPYGNHIFSVRAIGEAGIWSEAYNYSFTIKPPWWNSIWARIFYGIIVLCLIYLYVRWRTYSLIKKKKELELDISAATKEIRKKKEEAEKAMRRAERSEGFKKQFLANMSHEIRTPMNAILGMTNLTLDTKLTNKQREYLAAIKKSTENLLVIINDILDLSKLEAGKMNLELIPFNLSDQLKVVHDTLRFKAEEKSLVFEIKIDESVPRFLKGDPYRLNQILINLCGNSIKFTEKGSVLIEVTKTHKGIKFSVIDTGIGIAKSKINHLFSDFQQAEKSTSRQYGGTGLGLSISKTLIELQHGDIGVDSNEGKGSTFHFTLPLEAATKQNIEELNREKNLDVSTLKGIKLLLAEDNKFNQIVLHDTIKHLIQGSTIDIAENGKMAVELIKKNEYDVVLMDVNMPVMTGLEATKLIRKNLQEPKNKIIILALTASILNEDIEIYKRSGMNDFIPKPFTREELIFTLGRYFSTKD